MARPHHPVPPWREKGAVLRPGWTREQANMSDQQNFAAKVSAWNLERTRANLREVFEAWEAWRAASPVRR